MAGEEIFEKMAKFVEVDIQNRLNDPEVEIRDI